MKLLLIYRNPKMGFSIGKVFQPIEKALGEYCEVSTFTLPNSNYSISSLIGNVKALLAHLKNHQYDIIHITGAEHYLLPFLQRHHTVCTVHDMGFYTQQRNILKRIKKKLLWIDTLRFADAVTFISEKSRQEAMGLVKLREADCHVVNNPVDSAYRFKPKEFNAECPVVLHIGTKLNKNLERTAAALKGLKVTMRIVGKLNERQVEALKANGIDYTNVFNLTDEEIRKEYEDCDIVSFPSLYEGFGMPIIEGNAIGRVVVTSNLSPMKEVAGDAAVLVDPFSVVSIRQGFQLAITDNRKYVEQGLINVKRFTLSTIAETYIDVYNNVLAIY